MNEYFPTVVQVIPLDNFHVQVFFDDGKIVDYDATNDLKAEIMAPMRDIENFKNACTVMNGTLAWDISDTFNGLMMLPNLIGIIALCPVIIKLTKNYTARKIRGVIQKPLLSNYEEIQIEEQTELEKELYETV